MDGGADALDEFDQLPAHGAAVPASSRALSRGLNYSHDGMIDLIIANPGITQDRIATLLGYSASWISTVMATDAFQMRLEKRREEITDPVIKATLREQFDGLLRRSLDILRDKLKAPNPPDQLVLRTADLAAKALGYGARVEQTNVQVNIDTKIEEHGEQLVGLLRRRKASVQAEEPIDVESTKSEAASSG